MHAAAEERHFYPRALEIGVGASDADSAEAETMDAIKEHNENRDAVTKSADHEVGDEGWWDAITESRIANSGHMTQEERQGLADFRQHADLQTRHDIAAQSVDFMAQHASGVEAVDSEPEEYVEQYS